MAQPGPRVMNQAELAEAQELYTRGISIAQWPQWTA